MPLINLTTSPIRCAASARAWTSPLVRSACETASPAMLVDSATCRLISLIDADNCSVAAATAWTLVEASSGTDATVADLLLVCSAVTDIECAVVCSSEGAGP